MSYKFLETHFGVSTLQGIAKRPERPSPPLLLPAKRAPRDRDLRQRLDLVLRRGEELEALHRPHAAVGQ